MNKYANIDRFKLLKYHPQDRRERKGEQGDIIYLGCVHMRLFSDNALC